MGRPRGGQPEADRHDALTLSENAEFARLVRSFVEGLPAYRTELGDAMSGQQWDKAKSVAHILKGMGGSFGYPSVTQLAGKLEAALINLDMDNLETLYTKLHHEIDRVCIEAEL